MYKYQEFYNNVHGQKINAHKTDNHIAAIVNNKYIKILANMQVLLARRYK